MREEDSSKIDPAKDLVEASVDGILAFDRDSRYTAWNRAMERISGLRREDVIGRRAFDLFPFLRQTGEDWYFHEALAGRVAVAENRSYAVPETGRRGFFDGHYAPLRDVLGEVVGGVAVIRDITARKEAEEALRESEERYRAFIANSSEGVWRFELERPVAIKLPADEQLNLFYRHGYLAECNDAMARMYGYDRAEEITGARLGDFLVRDDPQNLEYLRAFIAAGYRLCDAESVETDKEGRSKVFSNNLVGVIENGMLLRAWGTQKDVTERKRVEESLKLYGRVLDSMTEGVSVADEHGFIIYTNPAEDEMFGYGRGELIGEHVTVQNAYPPEENERIVNEVIEQLRTKGVWYGEWSNRKKDGTPFTTFARITALEMSGRKHWVCVQEDITDRKRAERELEATQHRFQMFMEHLPGLAWVKDLDGRYVYANEATTKAFRMPREKLYGKTDDDVFAPETAAQFRENDRRALADGTGVQTVETLEQEDGIHHSIVSKFPILGPGGKAVMVGGVAIDITERTRAEGEREQLLAREQAARARAEEANRLKDEFLATVSHELRTPLTAILGWSRMLLSGADDGAGNVRALETIDRNAKAQAQIIEDLLDVSRIITGKLRLDIRQVEPQEVIEAAVEAMRPAAEAKNVRLQVLLDPQAGPVSGDADRLQQVVWNLVSNAVKFTPKGGRVQVRLERINSHVEITVADTGQGIASEFLPFVFDRFRQADQTLTRRHGGLGLGLSIVRQIVELHGGTVSVASPGEGRGAVFIVSLPLVVVRSTGASGETHDERAHPKVSGHVTFDCPPALEGLRVLVVDDDEDTRALLTLVLTQCKAEVLAVASATEALAALEHTKPDVLVSDIGMPDVDGFELIRNVRQLPRERGGRVPAVALTAYARVEDRMRALAAGYQMHVPKPVEPAELVTVIASLSGWNRN